MRIARSTLPRFADNSSEGEQAYRHWDRINGRYFMIADLILDDASLVPEVTFDTDTNVALLVRNRKVWKLQQLKGRRIVAHLSVLTPAGSQAIEAKRREFAAKHNACVPEWLERLPNSPGIPK
jgi:hypothetical protein